MNTILFRRASVLFSLAAVSVVVSGVSAQAQTVRDRNVSTSASALMAATDNLVAQTDTTVPSRPPGDTTPGSTEGTIDQRIESTPSDNITPGTPGSTTPLQTTPGSDEGTIDDRIESRPSDSNITPGTPGSTTPDSTYPTQTPDDQTTPDSTYPTQTPDDQTTPETTTPGISPGTETRGGSSYVGVAGNIGFGGDTALGDGSFAIISKIGLTNTLSVRPSALVGDNAFFMIPVTYDFLPRQAEIGTVQFTPAPYLGGGLAIATGDDSSVGAVITGGIDVPITPQFTANAGVNVGFVDGADVGILIGVGYNF